MPCHEYQPSVMRLLNTQTGRFKEISNPRQVRYAILSHVWAKIDDCTHPQAREQIYQDLVDIHRGTPPHPDHSFHPSDALCSCFSEKIRSACAYARRNHYDYIWIDTCCIDKTSSAELSQAINSMFDWYRWAGVCYAFLEDVPDGDDPFSGSSLFPESIWFRRGWTLQELIAPDTLLFLSSSWTLINSKHILADVIKKATLIDPAILRHTRRLDDACVAERMSWAQKRKTTAPEDEAYSLLGIFGIHMTPVYGEGPNAFIRLQKAILEQIGDHTIFAWGARCAPQRHRFEEVLIPPSPSPTSPDGVNRPWEDMLRREESFLLATSPADFATSWDIRTVAPGQLAALLHVDGVTVHPEYVSTSSGIRLRLPIITHGIYKLALLACRGATGECLALVLSPSHEGSPLRVMDVGTEDRLILKGSQQKLASRSTYNPYTSSSSFVRLATLSQEYLEHCPRHSIDISAVKRESNTCVYVHYRLPRVQQTWSYQEPILRRLSFFPPQVRHHGPAIIVEDWCQDLLQKGGYTLNIVGINRPAKREILRIDDPHRFTVMVQSTEEVLSITIDLCTSSQKCRSEGVLSALVTYGRSKTVNQITSDIPTQLSVDHPTAHDCSRHHIYHGWRSSSGGTAEGMYIIESTAPEPGHGRSRGRRCLRLTLRLEDPSERHLSDAREQSRHILSMEIFSIAEEKTHLGDSNSHSNRRGQRSVRAASPDARRPGPLLASSSSFGPVPLARGRTRSRSADGKMEILDDREAKNLFAVSPLQGLPNDSLREPGKHRPPPPPASTQGEHSSYKVPPRPKTNIPPIRINSGQYLDVGNHQEGHAQAALLTTSEDVSVNATRELQASNDVVSGAIGGSSSRSTGKWSKFFNVFRATTKNNHSGSSSKPTDN